MSDEFFKIKHNYFDVHGSDEVTATLFPNDLDMQDQILNMFFNMKQYECPDIISHFLDTAVIMEHFEFDSYINRKNKGGSDYRVLLHRESTRIEELAKNTLKNKDHAIIHGSIHSSASLQNYKKNFIRVFNKHYKNIDSYYENSTEHTNQFKNVEMWFFIEDVTPLGNFYTAETKEKGLILLYPYHVQEIVELLSKSQKIHGIIFGSLNRMTIFYKPSQTILSVYHELNAIIDENNFFHYDPKIIHWSQKIKKT
ncbi:MAG TPA: hypothetical protein PLP48_06530 [Acholeplasmataceae bacterium]|nr:hypothetical protein [Acholeplasmataceae bacterium]